MYFEKISNGNVLLKDDLGNILEQFSPTSVVNADDTLRILIIRNNKDQYSFGWKGITKLVTPAGTTLLGASTTQQDLILALVSDFFFLDSGYSQYVEDDTSFGIVPLGSWEIVNTGIPNSLLDIVIYKSISGANEVSVRKVGSTIDRKFTVRSVTGAGGNTSFVQFRVESNAAGEIEVYQSANSASFNIIGYWK